MTAGRTSFPRLWFRFIGPVIAVALLSRLDLREIVAPLARVRWAPLGASLALMGPLFLIKGWRWRLLLRAYGTGISLLEAAELYTISAGAGSLTPGAIGDFWKSFSPAVGGRAVGLWASALDRLYDVALLVIVGVVAAAAWADGWELRITVLLALAAMLTLAWVMRGRANALFAALLPTIPRGLTPRDGYGVPAAAATLAAAVVAFCRFDLLIAALGIPLSWRQEFIAFALTSGVAAMPLSVAGVGTRDVALIGYFGSHGIAPANAVALSTLCLALYLWNAVSAAALWLAWPPTRNASARIQPGINSSP